MQLPTTFNEINDLELLAKELVEGFIIGLHKSPYHGFSVEFAEHRMYHTGDNLKHVDWKVFGRKDIMFTKKYEEETNLRCCIAIDTSGSMYFPSTGINKLQHSCIASAALIHLLKMQLDAFGIAQIKADELLLSRFSTTSAHFKQQIADLQNLATTQHQASKPNVAQAIHELSEKVAQRSVIVLFTDIPFQEITDNSFLDSLLHLKHRKHEVIIFHLIDQKLEEQFDFGNEPYEFEDLETGKMIKLYPNNIKEQYLKKLRVYQQNIQDFCLNHNISLIPYNLQEPITKILQEYLQKRSKLM